MRGSLSLLRQRLSTAAIESLPITGQRYRAYDTGAAGLHVRVKASGKRNWYVRYRREGKPIDYRIGDAVAIRPSTAREPSSTRRSVRG
ncbi:MAG: DUF4102 domain-containing protein [Myxococcales bacterium]|nr:DUF4102 domain-containing protein [Myxococcales bacterium]